MSTHWTSRCETCEVDGPDIRRQAGAVVLMAGPVVPGSTTNAVWDNDPQEAWTGFLIDHEYHEVTLRVNG